MHVLIEYMGFGLGITGFLFSIFNIFDIIKVKNLHNKTHKILKDHLDEFHVRHQELRDTLNKHLDVYYSRHEEIRNRLNAAEQQILTTVNNSVNGFVKSNDTNENVVLPFKRKE